VTAIETAGLTKRYGPVTAVEDLTFAVRDGAVTGFLGPNGAGKTTTLRMILALARPTAGHATVLGRPYAQLEDPVRTVGANLEIAGAHPGRKGRDHLRALAAMASLPLSRVDEVLKLVELDGAGNRRAGKYSLGMRQRLGLAATLLGDPAVLILDEPANGLDPQGIRWLRDFLRSMAAEGRTVLVSSHVLAEVAQTVDDVVVIHRGKLVDQGPVARLTAGGHVVLRSPRPGEFRHRTIAPAVLISPNRGRLTLARLIAYVVTAALVGVAMVVVALAVGLPLLSGQPGPGLESSDYTAVIGGGILTAMLCCALGVGVGVLVRNQVAGVVGSLVWLLILEPLLPLIADDLAKGSILNAAGTLGGADSDEVSWAGALLVLGVWAGVFMVAGLLVDRRRDVD
jgi:ABC-2 type transport system ATP-binding protein